MNCGDLININDFVNEFHIEEWDGEAKEDLETWLKDEGLLCDCMEREAEEKEFNGLVRALDATTKAVTREPGEIGDLGYKNYI